MRTSILDYLEETTNKYPDKKAFCDLKISYTFSEITRLAKLIGTVIAKKTLRCRPVVIYMEKGAHNIPAFWGTVYAGCFYVPIDKDMPYDRICLIMDALRPAFIICDDYTADRAKKICPDIGIMNFRNIKEAEIDEKLLTSIRQDMKTTDLLYVLFTSGSTGTPKGVTISHAAVIDFMEWISSKYDINDSTILCNQAPFYFDASVPDLYIPLKTGATVYIPPKSYYTFPKKVLQYMVEKSVNTIVWVPSALCNVVNCRAFDICVPEKIKLIIFCGEVMPCKHLNVWMRHIPDAQYVNMYGPTEATYACMYYDIDREFSDDEKLPLGKACENSMVLLLKEDGTEAEYGEIGEICILGECLSYGYYNNKERSDEVFIQNPLNTNWSERIYRTGDLAKIDESGEMIFCGRKDFQIKRLGHRIELGEIENTIMSIEKVENACILFENETNDIIAVYSGRTDEKEIQKQLMDKLPSYMMPTRYEHLERLPMNLNGKTDRVKLREMCRRSDA